QWPRAQRTGRRRRPGGIRGEGRGARAYPRRRHHHPPRRRGIGMIRVSGLRKSFGTTTVLDGIDLTVDPATIFALLGPNGAGKTTIVRILSTWLRADAGEIHVAGHDVRSEPDAVRDAIGVTGQFSAVDGLLTGEENLMLMADLRHLPRPEGRRRVAA